eukprot:7312695-Pyramimonas_sp.AAC.1
MCAVTHAVAAIRASCITSYVATDRVRGVLILARSHMRLLPLGPSVEPPHVATKLVKGAPQVTRKHMRSRPLGPSVELIVGPGSDEGRTKMGAVTHAVAATGTFGGAPYFATKRVKVVPKWQRSRMRARPLWPSWGSPWGRETCEGRA